MRDILEEPLEDYVMLGCPPERSTLTQRRSALSPLCSYAMEGSDTSAEGCEQSSYPRTLCAGMNWPRRCRGIPSVLGARHYGAECCAPYPLYLASSAWHRALVGWASLRGAGHGLPACPEDVPEEIACRARDNHPPPRQVSPGCTANRNLSVNRTSSPGHKGHCSPGHSSLPCSLHLAEGRLTLWRRSDQRAH